MDLPSALQATDPNNNVVSSYLPGYDPSVAPAAGAPTPHEGTAFDAMFGPGQGVTNPGADPTGTFSRALGYAVTSPIRAVAGLSEAASNIFGLNPPGEGNFLDSRVNPEPATTTAGKVTDVIGQSFLPAALQMGVVGGAIGKLANVANMAAFPVAVNMAKAAGEFGVLGAQQDPTTGLEQAGEGLGIGALTALPRVARIPFAIALGLASKAFFDRKGEAPSVGGLSSGDIAGIQAAAIAMMGGTVGGAKPKLGPLPDHFSDTQGMVDALHADPGTTPNQLTPNQLLGIPEAPSGPPDLLNGPDYRRAQGVQNVATAQQAILANRPNAPTANQLLGIPEAPVGPPDLLTRAARNTAQPAVQGIDTARLIGLPEPSKLGQNDFLPGSEVNPPPSAEAQQAADLQRFRDARVIYAKDSPITPNPGAPISPSAIVPTDIQPLNQRMFSPEAAQAFKSYGIDTKSPEFQTALQRLQLGLLTHEALGDMNARRAALSQFFEEAKSAPPTAVEDSTKSPNLSNPLPEGGTIPVKGKTPQLPEFMRSEGGGIDPDLLQSLGIGAGKVAIGAAAGAALSPDDRAKGAAIGAALGLGAHFAPDIVGALQDFKARHGSFLGGEAGAIDAGDSLPKGKIQPVDFKLAAVANDLKDRVNARLADRTPSAYSKGDILTSKSGRQYTYLGDALPDYKGGPTTRGYFQDIFDTDTQFSGKLENYTSGNIEKDTKQWASNNNSEYQGKSPFGLHAFKELSTGGNFSVKESDLNADTVKSKAQAVRDAFAKPQVSVEEVLQRLQKSQSAQIAPEFAAALGRTAVGALVGGIAGGLTDGPNEHSGFITGAAIGAGAGFFGPSIARALTKTLGESKLSPPSEKTQASNLASLAKNWKTELVEKSGATLRGSDSTSDRFARWLDDNFNLSKSEGLRQALVEAKGQGAVLLDQLDQSLKRLSFRYDPEPVVKDLANAFLDGGDIGDFKKALDPYVSKNPDVGNYRDYAVSARTAIDGLQKMFIDNISNSGLRAKLEPTIGKWVSRSFRLFNNPTWKPSAESIEKLVNEISTKKIFGDAIQDDIRTYLNQYVREVKTTKGINASMGTPQGQAIGQQILKSRLDLSDAWREFLGEVTDPRARVINTVAKLRPMAETASYFGKVAKLDIDGMPASFSSYEAKGGYQAKILQDLQKPELVAEYANGNHEQIRQKLLGEGADPRLIRQLSELDAYQNVENHPKFGELRGAIVHRTVWDTLKTFDSQTDLFNHPLMRTFANSNTAVKLMHTAYNPLTAIRNYMTLPAFFAIARVNLMMLPEAWKVMTDASHPLRGEIIGQGISGVDQIRGEIFKEWQKNAGPGSNWSTPDLSKLGVGAYDLRTFKAYASKVNSSILDAYRIPDNITRIAAYMSAKERIAQALNLGLDHPDVIKKATEFTDRYTLNYDNVAPIIKGARQLPLVNLFISFHAEVARLAKNLVQDVWHGDQGNVAHHGRMYAMIPLALSAAVPDMLQSNSEAQLSDKDRADWQKAKTLLPDYSQYRYRYVTGRDRNGQFRYVDFTPLVHTDLLNQMAKAMVDGNVKSLLAINPIAGWENTPALNILISQATGSDLQTKRDFRFGAEGIQDRIASIAKEILPPWTPSVGSEAQRLQAAYTPNSAGSEGLTSSKTGIGTSPSEFWSSYFGGLTGAGSPFPGGRAGSVNLQVLQKSLENQAKTQIANEMAYANDILKSNASDEVKKQQMDKTRLALATIVVHYQERLGVNPERNTVPNNGATSPRQ